MTIKILISLSVAFCLFGCQSSTAPTSFPKYFSVGDTSIYSYQAFDINGEQGATTFDTVSIVSANTVDNNPQFVLSNGQIIVLGSSGIITKYIEADHVLTYSIPSRQGDTLFKADSVPTKINGYVSYVNIRVIAGNPDSAITVPAGIFHTQVFNSFFVRADDSSRFAVGKVLISKTEGIIQRETFAVDSTTKKLYLDNLKQLKQLKKK